MEKKFTAFRSKILIALILFVSVFSLFFSEYSNKENNISTASITTTVNPLDSFVLGIMDDAMAGNNINLRDTLKLNTWHKYSGINGGWADSTYNGEIEDSTFADSSLYYQGIKDLIENNYTGRGLKTMMDRPKISYLAWGQRSDYQCENSIVDNDYSFYTYNYHDTNYLSDFVDTSRHGAGERVRHCSPTPGNPSLSSGWVVKDLKSNREQINNYWWYEKNDTNHAWHIMPRIRIDSNFAAQAANFNKPICKIIILDFNGDTITSVTLKPSNFKSTQNSIYDGNYLEEYLNLDPDSTFTISQGSLFNPGNEDVGDIDCKVDFRIWYYGECEMWVDRVRVENEVAHDLLNGYYDDPSHPERAWLRWECNLAMEHPEYIRNFYIEEFEFNNIPCIKYVNEKIKQYTNDQLSLMVVLNYDLFRVHTPGNWWENQFTATQINKYLIQEAGLKTYLSNVYALEGWEQNDTVVGPGRESYHPPTLHSGTYDPANGILSYKKNTPAEYESWLQTYLDSGYGGVKFTHMMKLNDEIEKISGVPNINLAQGHSWFSGGHKLKEPSNEEFNLITSLAVSYGAKGIAYFSFPSFGSINSSYYFRGFLEPGTTTARINNAYGQNKWDAIEKINLRLKKWGPTIMSFDSENRKSYILRSEYSNLYSQTYFSDVVTYKPFGTTPACNEDNPNSSVSGTVFECREDRYLQDATFENSQPNTKYFMISESVQPCEKNTI